MEAKEILDVKIRNSLASWRTRVFESFKANCAICDVPLMADNVRFNSHESGTFFCKKCWEEDVLPELRFEKSVIDNAERDIFGLCYAIVFHTDLLQSDRDFAELGRYITGVLKAYVKAIQSHGLDPDTVMSYWPLSLFKRLTGAGLPDDWSNRLFTASVIEDVVRYHRAKGLFIYDDDGGRYWNASFRDAPAAYALRKEPLRKIQPEELLELLRREHR